MRLSSSKDEQGIMEMEAGKQKPQKNDPAQAPESQDGTQWKTQVIISLIYLIVLFLAGLKRI